MFNVGFGELMVFAIFATIILGPEKLPQAARFAAQQWQKFRRLRDSVQNEIDRELRLNELKVQMQNEIARLQELEQKMQQLQIESDAPNPQASSNPAPSPSVDWVAVENKPRGYAVYRHKTAQLVSVQPTQLAQSA